MSDVRPGSKPGGSLPRPPQTTLSTTLIMAGSVLMVIESLDLSSRLHTLDTRAQVGDFVATPTGKELGIGVDRLLDVYHVLALVVAVCAVAAAGVAWQVRSRSRPARVVMSVLAVPLFVAGLACGLTQASLLDAYVGPLVGAAAVTLWLQPSRDWFNGIARPVPGPRTRAAVPWPPPLPPDQQSWPPPTSDPRSWAPPTSPEPPLPGSAPPPPPRGEYAAAYAVPSATRPYPDPALFPPRGPAGPTGPRPTTVAWAAALTWIGSTLVASAAVVGAVVIVVRSDEVWRYSLRNSPD